MCIRDSQNCELLDGVPETGESAVVSIDFWESYDPEEVCKTGFALIGSDVSFKARALCFLCGSAGMDRVCIDVITLITGIIRFNKKSNMILMYC